MNSRRFIIFLCLLCLLVTGFSQKAGDPSQSKTKDTLYIPTDSLRSDSFDILISSDGPDADVVYSSKDSSYLDAKERMFYLFGDAKVTYQTYKLTAAKIRLDMNRDIAYAEGVLDSAGKWKNLPHFSDGQQEFDAHKMRYNFRTRKGIIDQVVTKYNDLYIRGTETKFIGGDPKDTTQKDVVFNRNAILTSCNAEKPHFGIRSTKQKFIKDKLVVIGPSNLEIMGVPTPIWLPFGFFPISQKRSAGLIIPQDYEYSQSLGFGLRHVGFYTPLGPNYDLSTQFDIYTRGSWGFEIGSNYAKRYKYRGTFNVGYSDHKIENVADGSISPQKSFSLRWSHAQASQANPYQNLSASVNIQRNSYEQLNYNNAGQVLNNTLSSNINYSRNFPGKPISLSLSASHSQNNQDKSVTLSLPNLNFQLQRIYPLKRKIKVGDEKWYEQISFQYTANAQSLVRASDSTFFTANTFKKLGSAIGVRQVASSEVNFRVLKYFNLAPSVGFKEIWNRQSINERNYITGASDSLVRDTIKGFSAAHLFNASLSLNTSIYGTIKFKKGFIRGIRHTIRPSISLNYVPSNEPYLGSYGTRVGTHYYSRFQGMTYDEISTQPGKQLGIGYNLNNIFEAKYLSRKDSTEKKLKLFDNINLGGFYNFAADSFKMYPLSASGSTRFFGGLTTVSLSASFDFYDIDQNNRRINTLLIKSGKGLLRVDGYMASIGTNFSIQDIKNLFKKEQEGKQDTKQDSNTPTDDDNPKKKKKEDPETFWQMFKGFYFNHNMSFGLARNFSTGVQTFGVLANSISTQGNVQLTKNWAIRVGNIGYDFKNHGLSYPDFGVTRILHCWQMTFNYQPQRGTYSFNLFASPGTFNFLKIPYHNNRFDPRNNL